MPIDLYEHQKDALDKLRSGSILVGGVGSGKSLVALTHYYKNECNGKIKTNNLGGFSPMRTPKDLYIITTARKRDTLEWERECCYFLLSKDRSTNNGNVGVFVDSWNNIAKYSHVKNSFFIFDEQKVIGNGTWVKAFLKITASNNWILLSATPADRWIDYVPVFIANGFYKNRTDFYRQHVIFSRFTKYPKIIKYLETSRLNKLKKSILVEMSYVKKTKAHTQRVLTEFDREKFEIALIKRWNIYENKPLRDAASLCFVLRKIVNSDPSRLEAVYKIYEEHNKIIVFYNFIYEKDLLVNFAKKHKITISEWNGQKHEGLPSTEKWIYLVQYTSGAEGWNCIETNTVVFYSQNYSYRAVVQAAGRIDRLNTPFSDLYYYHLYSTSVIDLAIKKALDNKRTFNEQMFMSI